MQYVNIVYHPRDSKNVERFIRTVRKSHEDVATFNGPEARHLDIFVDDPGDLSDRVREAREHAVECGVEYWVRIEEGPPQNGLLYRVLNRLFVAFDTVRSAWSHRRR